MAFFGKKRPAVVTLNLQTQRPAVRKSVCTGEMTGGYIDRADGKFHELQLISGPDGFRTFCQSLNVSPDDVETFY